MQRRYRRQKRKETGKKRLRFNRFIKAKEVRLIDEEGRNIGILPLKEALNKAEQTGLDLVEVYPKADPPVARIMDYGQFKYEQEKKERKMKAKQKGSVIKEIRLSFRIKGQDLEIRKNQAGKFLIEEGNKVKVEMVLKGREKAHKSHAKEMMQEFVKSLLPEGELEIIQPLTIQGGRLSITIRKKPS